MNDEELKLEEIAASHTLGGAGEVAKGEGGREGVDATLLFDTRYNINFADGGIICQVGADLFGGATGKGLWYHCCQKQDKQ